MGWCSSIVTTMLLVSRTACSCLSALFPLGLFCLVFFHFLSLLRLGAGEYERRRNTADYSVVFSGHLFWAFHNSRVHQGIRYYRTAFAYEFPYSNYLQDLRAVDGW
ncbi:hypothetical protein QBC37DRAFT_421210 [Rhypophila decipiens]|uniref:Uncharacterized protein n=1 Tax=Rhypophila decipiens TaxID=261697 RepID=A0AAN6Y9K5_9PEZI|nr:hypothetical protein QBC37DRAFT_421210 [Rhypophila decipiens]